MNIFIGGEGDLLWKGFCANRRPVGKLVLSTYLFYVAPLVYTCHLYCHTFPKSVYCDCNQSVLHVQSFMGKACDHRGMPWHTSAKSKVCTISHVFTALKWEVFVAMSCCFYNEFNVQCLLFLLQYLLSLEMTIFKVILK